MSPTIRRLIVILSVLSPFFISTGLELSQLWPYHGFAVWYGALALFAFGVSSLFVPRLKMQNLAVRIWAWSSAIALGFWSVFAFVSALFIFSELFISGWRDSIWPPLVSLGMAGFVSVAGLLQALRGPRIKEVLINVDKLPRDLEHIRIAHISDLHIGSTIRNGYVRKVVRKLTELKADLVVLTGDVADGSPDLLQDVANELAAIQSALGKFFVTGNHEYYWGAEGWSSFLKQIGFSYLENSNAIVKLQTSKLMVAGVPDRMIRHFSPEISCDPHQAAVTTEEIDFKILLAHRPGVYEHAEKAGFDLQLSGHTHAGQFFPWSLFIGLFHRYPHGLHRHGKLWIYVSPGTGFWGPVNRFLVPAEITLLRLAQAT